jgi:hypothetical protein
MQTVLWQYRESAKRNALFIFIWAHTADTIKQSNRRRQQNPGSQNLARFFFRFKPCQPGSMSAWLILPGGCLAALYIGLLAQDELQQLLLKVVSLPIFSTDLSLPGRSQGCKFFEVTPTLTLTVVKLRSRSFATRFASGFESRNKQNLKGDLGITGRMLKT